MTITASSYLIKEFTAHKVQAAIDTAQIISTQSHPFEESKFALEQVEIRLKDLLQRLHRPSTNDAILRTYCKRALVELTEIIPLIGFIERSTDVTGPVEFFGPFSRITKRLIGNTTKLILSSTWQFNPHTIIYPDQVVGVADFVFVGFPVSESDNAFLTPLAAHELGHNLWQKKRLEQHFKPIIGEAVAKILKEEYQDRLSPDFKVALTSATDLVGQANWFTAYLWASKQLEECFCDFLGGYLFGPSYLYAFTHFSCPGLESSDPKYPPAIQRHNYLLHAAQEIGWDLNASMTSTLFEALSRSTGIDTSPATIIFLEVADKARENLLPQVKALALQYAKDADLLFDQKVVPKIKNDFVRGLPCVDVPSLASICNAGWELFISDLSADFEGADKSLKSKVTPKLINELMLKSFEILEIETVLKEQAECSTQMPFTV